MYIIEYVASLYSRAVCFGSSGMWCLRRWCLLTRVLSPYVMARPTISFGNICYYQTPHP